MLAIVVFFPIHCGICCSRYAVSRMTAAAAAYAVAAMIKRVGQNHRKSFRFVSHFDRFMHRA